MKQMKQMKLPENEVTQSARNQRYYEVQIRKVLLNIKQLKRLMADEFHRKLSWTPGYVHNLIPIKWAARKLRFPMFHNSFYKTNMLYYID